MEESNSSLGGSAFLSAEQESAQPGHFRDSLEEGEQEEDSLDQQNSHTSRLTPALDLSSHILHQKQQQQQQQFQHHQQHALNQFTKQHNNLRQTYDLEEEDDELEHLQHLPHEAIQDIYNYMQFAEQKQMANANIRHEDQSTMNAEGLKKDHSYSFQSLENRAYKQMKHMYHHHERIDSQGRVQQQNGSEGEDSQNNQQETEQFQSYRNTLQNDSHDQQQQQQHYQQQQFLHQNQVNVNAGDDSQRQYKMVYKDSLESLSSRGNIQQQSQLAAAAAKTTTGQLQFSKGIMPVTNNENKNGMILADKQMIRTNSDESIQSCDLLDGIDATQIHAVNQPRANQLNLSKKSSSQKDGGTLLSENPSQGLTVIQPSARSFEKDSLEQMKSREELENDFNISHMKNIPQQEQKGIETGNNNRNNQFVQPDANSAENYRKIKEPVGFQKQKQGISGDKNQHVTVNQEEEEYEIELNPQHNGFDDLNDYLTNRDEKDLERVPNNQIHTPDSMNSLASSRQHHPMHLQQPQQQQSLLNNNNNLSMDYRNQYHQRVNPITSVSQQQQQQHPMDEHSQLMQSPPAGFSYEHGGQLKRGYIYGSSAGGVGSRVIVTPSKEESSQQKEVNALYENNTKELFEYSKSSVKNQFSTAAGGVMTTTEQQLISVPNAQTTYFMESNEVQKQQQSQQETQQTQMQTTKNRLKVDLFKRLTEPTAKILGSYEFREDRNNNNNIVLESDRMHAIQLQSPQERVSSSQIAPLSNQSDEFQQHLIERFLREKSHHGITSMSNSPPSYFASIPEDYHQIQQLQQQNQQNFNQSNSTNSFIQKMQSFNQHSQQSKRDYEALEQLEQETMMQQMLSMQSPKKVYQQHMQHSTMTQTGGIQQRGTDILKFNQAIKNRISSKLRSERHRNTAAGGIPTYQLLRNPSETLNQFDVHSQLRTRGTSSHSNKQLQQQQQSPRVVANNSNSNKKGQITNGIAITTSTSMMMKKKNSPQKIESQSMTPVKSANQSPIEFINSESFFKKDEVFKSTENDFTKPPASWSDELHTFNIEDVERRCGSLIEEGDYQAAKPLLERIEVFITSNFTKRHPQFVFLAYLNARMLQGQCQSDFAVKYCEKGIKDAIREDSFQDAHLYKLILTLRQIAVSECLKMVQFEKARVFMVSLIEQIDHCKHYSDAVDRSVKETAIQFENKFGFALHVQLAEVLVKQEQYLQATEQFKQALQKSPFQLDDLRNIEVTFKLVECLLKSEKRQEEAISELKQLVKVLRSVIGDSKQQQQLGEHEKQLIEAIDMLGKACFECGHFTEASDYFEQCLALKSKLFGSAHQSTAIGLFLSGKSLAKSGSMESAISRFLQCIPIFDTHMGPSNIYSANSLLNLAEISKSCEKRDDALRYYQLALPRFVALFGKSHFNCLCINLNSLYLVVMQTSTQSTHLIQTLFQEIITATEQSINQDSVQILNEMSNLLRTNSFFQQALEGYILAKEIMEKIEVQDARDNINTSSVGSLLNTKLIVQMNIASTYFLVNKKELAVRMYENTLGLAKNDQELTLKIHNQIGLIHQQLNKRKEAAIQFTKALNILAMKDGFEEEKKELKRQIQTCLRCH